MDQELRDSVLKAIRSSYGTKPKRIRTRTKYPRLSGPNAVITVYRADYEYILSQRRINQPTTTTRNHKRTLEPQHEVLHRILKEYKALKAQEEKLDEAERKGKE